MCLCHNVPVCLQRLASSSSVPKSTSSMTLPVSSPSSHSQFEGGGGGGEHHGTTQASPKDVERRLEELSRYVLCTSYLFNEQQLYLKVYIHRQISCKFGGLYFKSLSLKSNKLFIFPHHRQLTRLEDKMSSDISMILHIVSNGGGANGDSPAHNMPPPPAELLEVKIASVFVCLSVVCRLGIESGYK